MEFYFRHTDIFRKLEDMCVLMRPKLCNQVCIHIKFFVQYLFYSYSVSSLLSPFDLVQFCGSHFGDSLDLNMSLTWANFLNVAAGVCKCVKGEQALVR